MSGAVEARLAELGLTLPEVVPPLAAYQPAVVSGRVRVHLRPAADGGRNCWLTGKVGAEVTAGGGQGAGPRPAR